MAKSGSGPQARASVEDPFNLGESITAEVWRRGRSEAPGPDEAPGEPSAKRAVLYLRVSSRGQVETDVDDDGLSIAAQRSRSLEKARQIGAHVVEEYIERAESAKTNDRPELQRLMRRLSAVGDIDYVIVWKVDRLARNRRDDANMLYLIEASGARLVSATENVDETPAGRLMHGMLASFAEYYSGNLAAEVIKGSTEKAKRGGTPGMAPLGYVNVAKVVDGHEMRSVDVDETRGPLVSTAFEAYATGMYSLSDVTALLEGLGLRTRGSRRYAPRPLSKSMVHRLLTKEYYTGVVVYRGKTYPGRHTPLVSRDTFDRVQRVLAAHRLSGERDRKHGHYLKGSLFCGRCGGRFTYSRNAGNGGVYEYFVCLGAQRGECSIRSQRVELVQRAVEDLYGTVVLSAQAQTGLRRAMQDYCRELERSSRAELTRTNALLGGLKERERTLLHARFRSGLSEEVFTEELAQIQREREQIERVLRHLDASASELEGTLDMALRLLGGGLQQAYVRADDQTRRFFNQALFQGLWIDDEAVERYVLEQPFHEIVTASHRATRKPRRRPARGEVKSKSGSETGEPGSEPLALDGLSKHRMVGRLGLEPRTPGLKGPCSTD